MIKEKRKYDTKKGFTKSEEVINLLKRKLGLDDKILAVEEIWRKEAGPQLKDTVLEGFNNGQIHIGVSSSSQFQEVNLRKKELINKINQYFGQEKVVKEIKIKLKQERR